jgi:hypothetical protein
MRWTLAIGVVLLVLLAGYMAWPLVALYQIASAIETKNTAALREMIDLPLLRRSLAEQIVAEYLKLTGKTQRLGPFATSIAVGVGATAADPIVARLLNLENLIEFLNKGSGGAVAGASLPIGFAPINASSLDSVWRTWLNSEYSGARFLVSLPPDKTQAQQFRLSLDLIQWHWKLAGIELPEQLRVQLAQEMLRTNPTP